MRVFLFFCFPLLSAFCSSRGEDFLAKVPRAEKIKDGPLLSGTDAGRFVLLAGKIGDESALFRIDTATGQTWVLRDAQAWVWADVQERDRWAEAGKAFAKALRESLIQAGKSEAEANKAAADLLQSGLNATTPKAESRKDKN